MLTGFLKALGMKPPAQTAPAQAGGVLNLFLETSPSAQNVINLFAGEWSSQMPSESGLAATPGTARLFEDDRIHWASKILGGFAGKKVLELGPLEGGHSYMLQKARAASITAIESNTRAYLKCLCVKELFSLDRVHFSLGDFREFLKTTNEKYEVLLASGVLYHMTDPLTLLADAARVSDNLVIWTHFYDAAAINNDTLRFESPLKQTHGKFEGIGAKRYYQDALNWTGFCGGTRPDAIWLERGTILRFLESLGFNQIDIDGETLNHPNGPCFTLVAKRKKRTRMRP